jgi:nucleoside-diphosphate-sugar epimerase/2-polyprenyl-3-methyl-5-hydroxy-6-metoxy-1,4-benzoquinol methylase
LNILITGGTGFIGSRLAIKCWERGDTVRIYAQENTDAERANSQHLRDKGAEIILGSMTDPDRISRAVEDIDVVFHLAAAQHEANISNQIFYDVNVSGTRNIIEASIKSGVKRFVHGSTIGVYGDSDSPLNESSPCNPDNIYGQTKLEGEKLALSYKDRIPLTVIRISETYGPGDRRLLKLFKIINKNSFFMIGDGKNLHQLIYVDDLVSGMLKASESEKALGEIILLVGEKPITTNDMVNSIARALNARILSFKAPLLPLLGLAWILESILRPLGIQPPLHRRRMDFFKKNYSFSTTKAWDLLAFSPRYSFEQGTLESAQWYKDEGLLKGSDGNAHHALPVNMQVDKDLAAQIEPFDAFWEAPKDVEKGFEKFAKFYKRNYFKYMPKNKNVRTLVISCGAGYMVKLMNDEGYMNVLGIDSNPNLISVAEKHGLNCRVANAFPFLREKRGPFDLIFVEQEINHLTKSEVLTFLDLCHQNLNVGGKLFVHSLNGANPMTGSEALAQNFNHFNTFTEYSLRQVIGYSGFGDIRIFPLNLYIFYENPINYIGLTLNSLLNLLFRLGFIFYGKENKIFSKKIAAVCKNSAKGRRREDDQ